MSASIYRVEDGTYLAVLSCGQRIRRGSLADLATALNDLKVLHQALLFGDWMDGTALLTPLEKTQLAEQLMAGKADDA